MQKRDIEDLAFILSKFKLPENNNTSKPIVFIGAGASASAGIPLTGKIIEDVLNKYGDKPTVKRLTDEEKKNYYQIMSALSASERRDLFSGYINDPNVKINVTNIYLAQLLKEGFVDYIFTPNFDDLILKACSLFNIIPPVYDLSILNDFTTTPFQKKSVTYLHGQHHGQWLLNATGELDKVKSTVPKLFERICDRTWIIIGYSGEDELLDEIAKIGSFENELYWIGYKNNDPIDRVKEKLLSNVNKNAYLISGYDSDSFFLKLHSELKLDTPEIFNKPFSFLQAMINNVKDIEENEDGTPEHKDLFKNVKERMEISKKWVDRAIIEIESFDSLEKFKQEIIEATIKKKFNKAVADNFLLKLLQAGYKNANEELSNYFNSWGIFLWNDLNKTSEEYLYNACFEKYKIATELNSKNYSAFGNWGLVLSDLARVKKNEGLYYMSIDKFKAATAINARDTQTLNNWGTSLADLAKLKSDENLYIESIEKYKKATEINPKHDMAFNNLGATYNELAVLKSDKELFLKSLECYEKSIQLNPNNPRYYGNWANGIFYFARFTNDPQQYLLSFEKYKKCQELAPEDDINEDNWLTAILNYSQILSEPQKQETLIKAKEKALSIYNSFGKCYNISCTYALLKEKDSALKYLNESLLKNQITTNYVENDPDWDDYKNDPDFIRILEKYKTNS